VHTPVQSALELSYQPQARSVAVLLNNQPAFMALTVPRSPLPTTPFIIPLQMTTWNGILLESTLPEDFMTTLIYHEDSYKNEIKTVIEEVNEDQHAVVLAETIFFPGGGGQPADFGVLKSDSSRLTVKRAKRISGDILHLIEDGDPLPERGKEVTASINWEHRYQLMRTHTALHILCGVVFRDYGASVTGGNMEPLSGRMDFEFARLQQDLVQDIEASINKEVDKGLPVTWRELPRQEAFQIPDLIRTKINLLPEHIQEVRVVEIHGLDLQADGGTHVKNTSEVGGINIVDYKSKGAENKRIYIELPE